MKKYALILFAFIFSLGLFAFNTNSVSAFVPGCSSTSGFSITTGKACDGSTPPPPTYPSGCSSTSGWSITTGRACDGSTRTQPIYPSGCFSTSGFSTTTGKACN